MLAKTVEKILLEFNPQKRNLLPVLKNINSVFGYVSAKDAQKVADYFSLPLALIFQTASFYDEIKTKKSSAIVIQVCSSSNCAVNGAFNLVREIEIFLKIKAGDDNNLKIKLEEISCLGHCGEGPIMLVNGKKYERVNVSELYKILEEWLGN